MFDLFPTVNAQVATRVLNQNPTVGTLLSKIYDNIIFPIISVLFLFSFLVFVYGMFEMISSGDDSDKRTNGKNSILWSVVGMVIMLSVYGIIRLISNTLGVEDPFS